MKRRDPPMQAVLEAQEARIMLAAGKGLRRHHRVVDLLMKRGGSRPQPLGPPFRADIRCYRHVVPLQYPSIPRRLSDAIPHLPSPITLESFYLPMNRVFPLPSHDAFAPFALQCAPPWLTVRFRAPQRAVSWSLNRPGLVDTMSVAWLQVRDADLPADREPAEWFAEQLASVGLCRCGRHDDGAQHRQLRASRGHDRSGRGALRGDARPQ